MRTAYERAFSVVAAGCLVTGFVGAIGIGAALAAQENQENKVAPSSSNCHVSNVCLDDDNGQENDSARSSGESASTGGSSGGSGAGSSGDTKTKEPGAGDTDPKDPDKPAGS